MNNNYEHQKNTFLLVESPSIPHNAFRAIISLTLWIIELSCYNYSSSKLEGVANTSNEKSGQLNKLSRVPRSQASAKSVLTNHRKVNHSILLNQWLCADENEILKFQLPLPQ